MRRALLLLLALAVMMLPACGDNDDGAAEPTATATVTVTAEPSAGDTESPTGPGAAPGTPQQWPTDNVSKAFTGAVPPVPSLLAIRVGSHPNEGFDRVAFEFDTLPGYRVGYQSEIVYDGSGEPVNLAGEAFIQVIFDPAQAHDDAGNSTLPSPPVDPVAVNSEALAAYVLNGDFEGVVSVGLGLSGKVGFLVRELQRENGNVVVYVDMARP